MSRPIKVPECLYEDLRQESDREGTSVMEALQRRLRVGADDLRDLGSVRATLENQLKGAQSRLEQAEASNRVDKSEVTRLRADIARLSNAVAARNERIAVLEDALATVTQESGETREAREDAERASQKQQETLQTLAILVGLAACAWIGWQWWKRRRNPVVAKQDNSGVPQPVPPAGMLSNG